AAFDCEYFGSAEKFAEYYAANFDRSITYHMASGAVCILAYVQAAKIAGSLDIDAVRDALSSMDYKCFYGHLKFTPEGDGDPSLLGPLLIQRQAGEIEVIAPSDVSSAKPIYPAPSWQDRA